MNQRPVMVINDVGYIERKPDQRRATDCEQCAFAFDMVGCHTAVMGAAQSAFGGDCLRRDVVYVFEKARAAA